MCVFVVSQESLAAYWNGVYFAVLVYDVSSQESFEACKSWLEELKKARCVLSVLCMQGCDYVSLYMVCMCMCVYACICSKSWLEELKNQVCVRMCYPYMTT